jgi:hypothetical protein
MQGLPLERAVRMGNYFGGLAVGQIGVPRLEGLSLPELFKRVEAPSSLSSSSDFAAALSY